MITLVIPFINRGDLTKRTIEVAYQGIGQDSTRIIAYDNGSEEPLNHIPDVEGYDFKRRFSLYSEPINRGIIHAIRCGYELAKASPDDIIVFIHNDILIWEKEWDRRIQKEFDEHPGLGLAGFVGGRGVGLDGGRFDTMSNMQGREWGGCLCHRIVGQHHGRVMTNFEYVSTLDACVMVYRDRCLAKLMDSSSLNMHRPPNHWYDRDIPLRVIQDQKEKVGVIGIPFDHYSANTGHQTKSHQEATKRWAKEHNLSLEGTSIDQLSYNQGREEFEKEWGSRLPLVFENSDYHWG